MQSLIDALKQENWQVSDALVQKVNELKAACLELDGTGTDVQDSIDQAKELWNMAVARSNVDSSLDAQKIKFLPICRELSYLTLQLHLRKPWDDKTLVNLFEMTTRLVRAFSQAKDIGKVRLYLSKSAELNDELKNMDFVAPWLQAQIQNSLIILHAEKAKLALESEQQDLNMIIDEAMDTISPQYLSYYVSDMVNLLYKLNAKDLFSLMEKIYERIRPIEDFPAHISDDVLFFLIDLCLLHGLKAKLELAGGYLNMITSRSKKYYVSKMKHMLLTGATVEAMSVPILRYAESGASLVVLFEMFMTAKPIYLDACLSTLNAVDIRTLAPEVRGELVALNIMRMVTKSVNNLAIMKYTSDHLSFLGPDPLIRLQRLLFEKAEASRAKKTIEEALNHLKLCKILFFEGSTIDRRNEPVLDRLMVQCLLDLNRFDEAELMVVGMPFDLHGLTLRFLLAVGMRKEKDAIQYIKEIAKQPGVTLNHLLSLANRCKEARLYVTLADVFTAAINRFRVEAATPKLKMQILSSAAVIVVQEVASVAEKAAFVCDYSTIALPIIQSDAEIESANLFFKISTKVCPIIYPTKLYLAWNTAVEAGREKVFAKSAQLFRISDRILCSGRFKSDVKLSHAKISCLAGCLSAYCRCDETNKEIADITADRRELLKEIKRLMEDIEITSIYLPTQTPKRPKLDELISLDVDIPFDRLGMTRVYDELKFMLEYIDCNIERLLNSLEAVSQSGTIESLEDLLNWCLERNVSSQACGVMKLLELLAMKVISNERESEEVDIIKFSKLYRGMSIFALAQEQNKAEGAALAYYQQALTIIKIFKVQYPPEESCWLAISSYNHAIRISSMNAEKARAWCELSLAFLHHTGQFRDRFETAIRDGYSRILDRITL